MPWLAVNLQMEILIRLSIHCSNLCAALTSGINLAELLNQADTACVRTEVCMSIKIIVLAAGLGKRFESDAHKCLVPLQFGEGTLSRLLRQIVQVGYEQDIVVVTGYQSQEVRSVVGTVSPGATTIFNPDFSNGSSLTSLKAAVSALYPDEAVAGIWVLFADTVYQLQSLTSALRQPRNTVTLIGMEEEHGAFDAIGLVKCSDTNTLQEIGPKRNTGGLTMLPAVFWPRNRWSALIAGESQGYRSQWEVLRSCGPLDALVEVVSTDSIRDIDTTDDLERIKKSLVTGDVAAYFKANICKEERSRDLPDRIIGANYVKTCQSEWHANVESSALQWIAKQTAGTVGPTFAVRTGQVVATEYIEGIRLFDLFRLLKEVGQAEPALASRSNDVGVRLLQRSLDNLCQIQTSLLSWPLYSSMTPYPWTTHINDLLVAICNALELPQLSTGTLSELAELETKWSNDAVVPFRDATPKNIMVEIPEVVRRGHHETKDRVRLMANWLRQSDHDAVRIVDYDFTSAEHLTSPEDDIISLLAHQGSIHLGMQLLGNDSEEWSLALAELPVALGLPFSVDRRRTARALLVRYLRFGGRKLMYRLVNPAGYQIRFRNDSPYYYFNALPQHLCKLDPEFSHQWPNILTLLNTIADRINQLPKWSSNEAIGDAYMKNHGSGLTYWQESPIEGLLRKSE